MTTEEFKIGEVVRVLSGDHRNKIGTIINIDEFGVPGEPILLVKWDLPGGDCRTWYLPDQLVHACAIDRLRLVPDE